MSKYLTLAALILSLAVPMAAQPPERESIPEQEMRREMIQTVEDAFTNGDATALREMVLVERMREGNRKQPAALRIEMLDWINHADKETLEAMIFTERHLEQQLMSDDADVSAEELQSVVSEHRRRRPGCHVSFRLAVNGCYANESRCLTGVGKGRIGRRRPSTCRAGLTRCLRGASTALGRCVND